MKPALELAVENYQRLRDEAAAAMAHAQKELSSLRNTLAHWKAIAARCRTVAARRTARVIPPRRCNWTRTWLAASTVPSSSRNASSSRPYGVPN